VCKYTRPSFDKHWKKAARLRVNYLWMRFSCGWATTYRTESFQHGRYYEFKVTEMVIDNQTQKTN
jgi:hypothetical protein